jgi:hypothetical protein
MESIMPMDVAAARAAALQIVEKSNTDKANDLVYHASQGDVSYVAISVDEVKLILAEIKKLPVEDQKLVLAEMANLSTAKPDGSVYFMPYTSQYLNGLASQLGVGTRVSQQLPAPPDNGDGRGTTSPELDALIHEYTVEDRELSDRDLNHLMTVTELDGEVTERDGESLYHIIDRGGIDDGGPLPNGKYFSITEDAVSKLYRFFEKHGLPQANEAVYLKPRIEEPEFRRGGEANMMRGDVLETYPDQFFLPSDKPGGAGYEAKAYADHATKTVTLKVSTPWADGNDRFINDPTEPVLIYRGDGSREGGWMPFLTSGAEIGPNGRFIGTGNEEWTLKVVYEKAPGQWVEMFPPKKFNTGPWPMVTFG